MSWKVVSASARGPTHVLEAEPCGDAAAAAVSGAGLVAVVCDGAGSAALGPLGARVCASTLTDLLAAELLRPPSRGEGPGAGPGEGPGEAEVDIPATVRTAISRVRDLLRAIALAQGRCIEALDTTVVGAVMGMRGGWMFHVGDGAALATSSMASGPVVMSPPENGEFANETFFVTRPDWSAHLRFTEVPRECDVVSLMTDGVTPFCIKERERRIDLGFFRPVSSFLEKSCERDGASALLGTLDSPRAAAISKDDKTFLWALRHPTDRA